MGSFIFPLAGLALFMLGLVGFILKSSHVQKLVSLNIFVSGIFLLIISLSISDEKVDSVAVAMVLTGLVVTLGVSAFALMLIRSYYKIKE